MIIFEITYATIRAEGHIRTVEVDELDCSYDNGDYDKTAVEDTFQEDMAPDMFNQGEVRTNIITSIKRITGYCNVCKVDGACTTEH